MTHERPAEPDHVDRQLESWADELPAGVDLETEGIVERIHWLDRYLDRTTEETLEAHGLTPAEWKTLGHLRLDGPPYHGKPGKLASGLGLSSGAMTARLDGLEGRGLVRRLDDPDDRRGVVVELTDEGYRLWGRSVDAQGQKEALVASALDADEKRQLNDLLRRLMHAFREHHGAPRKRATGD